MEKINITRKEKIYMSIMCIGFLCGIIHSIYSLFNNIDLTEFLKTLNIVDIEYGEWYKKSFIYFLFCTGINLGAIILFPKVKECYKKDLNEINISIIILISVFMSGVATIIMLLMQIILLFVFGLNQFIFWISSYFDIVIRLPLAEFFKLLSFVFEKLNIPLELGVFIGKNEFARFLQIIIWAIITPYTFSNLIKLMENILKMLSGSKTLVEYLFKYIYVIFSLNNIRYIIYMFLFFISLISYGFQVESTAVIGIIKESLVSFVLLDTIIYTIYSNGKERQEKIQKKRFLDIFSTIKEELECAKKLMIINNSYLNTNRKVFIKFNDDKILQRKCKKNPVSWNELLDKIYLLSNQSRTCNELFIELNQVLQSIDEIETEL